MTIISKITGMLNPFKRYMGVKPVLTACASIIGDSADLIPVLEEMHTLQSRLDEMYPIYKTGLEKFRSASVPGSAETTMHTASKYYNQRQMLANSIQEMDICLSKMIDRIDFSIDNLEDITFNSQIILFNLNRRIDRFADDFIKKIRIANKQKRRLEIKKRSEKDTKKLDQIKREINEFAEKINNARSNLNEINSLKEEFKAELRNLWEASKFQEREVPSKYLVKEFSIRGNIIVARIMKRRAIESGNLLNGFFGGITTDNFISKSRMLIKDIRIIQMNAKILIARMAVLLHKTNSTSQSLSPSIAHKFEKRLEDSQSRIKSVKADITQQSIRLFLDTRIRAA